LTEDACVLVSETLLKELKDNGFFEENKDITPEELVEQEDDEPELHYYRLNGSLATYSTPESLKQACPEPHPEEKLSELVLSRMTVPEDKRKEVDAEASAKFIKEYVVVMFGIKLAAITASSGMLFWCARPHFFGG
jgi:hypothetical protein